MRSGTLAAVPDPAVPDPAVPDPAVPDPAVSDVSSALTEAPVLAHLIRGGVVESVHRGTVVVTAPDGSVQWALGDPSGPVFARSANKPIQASAMARAGLDLPHRLLALACASHSGEPFHLEGALAILASAGRGESDLQNTPPTPSTRRSTTPGSGAAAPRRAWLRTAPASTPR